MNSFYDKLSRFGSLISNTSQSKQINIANYFVVVHPSHPVVKQPEKAKPKVDFVKGCPREIKKQVKEILNAVF